MSMHRLTHIRALVSDVDGVLTDGTLHIGEMGETKIFHVRDGLAIRLMQKAGMSFAILSGRASRAVHHRASELGITVVKTDRLDKQVAFLEIEQELGIPADQIAYIGDDLPDLAPLQLAGVSFCPQDAVDEVKRVCDFIAPHFGGKGAVRFAVETILKAQGRWQEMVSAFEVTHV